MAETAKILSPDKRVLLPDLAAGCSLADSITAEQLRDWKAEHPGAVVVSYVNTTAAVKAESDYCCTSSNARAVIDAIPADRQILFLPDMFLGLWLQRVTGRKLTIWLGECHVHAGIRPSDVERVAPRGARRRAADPPRVRLHQPGDRGRRRRGATSSRPRAWSPTPSARRPRASSSRPRSASCIGSSRRRRASASCPVNREAICQYMKLTTLEKVRDSLRLGIHEIDVPAEMAARARARPGADDRDLVSAPGAAAPASAPG